MAVIKIKKRDNPYVMFDKICLIDSSLNLKAKGLHAMLMSFPEDWEIRIADLVKRSKDGCDSIYGAIKELVEAGFLCRQKSRQDNGKFEKINYIAHEIAVEPDEHGDESVSLQAINSGNPIPVNDHLSKQSDQSQEPFQAAYGKSVSSDSQRVQPLTDLPYTVNPTLLNNKVNNNKRTKAAAQEIDAARNDDERKIRVNELSAAASFVFPDSAVSSASKQHPGVGNDLEEGVDKTRSVGDSLIGGFLTASQTQAVKNKAKFLRKLVNESQRDSLVDDITWLLLNLKSFSQAGRDFHHKLNTIAKCIRQGRWQPPPTRVLEQAKQEQQMEKQSQRDYQTLLNEQAHLAFLLAHAPTLEAKEKLNAQLTSISDRLADCHNKAHHRPTQVSSRRATI